MLFVGEGGGGERESLPTLWLPIVVVVAVCSSYTRHLLIINYMYRRRHGSLMIRLLLLTPDKEVFES